MMKKFWLALLCFTLIICLAACGKDNTPENKDDHTHSFVLKTTSEEYLSSAANCNTAAVYYYSCACGESSKGHTDDTFSFGNPTGNHIAGNWVLQTTATCQENGIYVKKCTVCSNILDSKYDAMGEHIFRNGECTLCGVLESSRGLKFVLNSDGLGYTLVGLQYPLKSVVIDTYDNLPVTAIAEAVFMNDSTIEEITIGKSVKTIGKDAFYETTGLKKLNIISLSAWCGITFENRYSTPLRYIYANNESSNLLVSGKYITELAIPSGVSSISAYAFSYLRGVTSVKLPDSVTSIGEKAFYSCENLENVTLSDNLTYIGLDAFESCNKIHYNEYMGAYYLPSNNNTTYALVKVIDKNINAFEISPYTNVILHNAFRNCVHLLSITIPKNVYLICDSAFYGCHKLVEVYNLSSIEITKNSADNGMIGYYALDVFTSADAVSFISKADDGFVLYNNGTIAYVLAYNGINADITLPENYAIHSYAFYDNKVIETVKFGESVTEIPASAFEKCTALKGINSPDTIAIPDYITAVGEKAFFGCTSVKSLVTGKGVKLFGDLAFGECTRLETLFFNSSAVTQYSTTAQLFYGVGTDSNGTELTFSSDITFVAHFIFYAEKSPKLVNVKFEDGSVCTSIESSAFKDCIYLESIELPAILAKIEDYAFEGCISLKEISIPDGVTAVSEGCFKDCVSLLNVALSVNTQSIDAYAFEGCTNLEKIVITDNITSIGNLAFEACENLLSVEFSKDSKLTKIGAEAFKGCASLTEINFPASLETIGSYAFHAASKLESITFNSNIKNIGEYAFSKLISLASVQFNGNVGTISQYAFYECARLAEVAFDGDVKNIEAFAFANLPSLTSLVFGGNTESIRSNAFENLTALKTLVFGGTVKSIGSYAFANLESLETLTFNYKVGSIEEYAFTESALTSLVFNNEVQSIGTGAFSESKHLTNINFASVVKTIETGAFMNCVSLKDIVIPEGLEYIGDACFSGCSAIESLTLPFIGQTKPNSNTVASLPLGHIFGSVSYENSYAVLKNDTEYYYIPNSLTSVTVTSGDKIYAGAFKNCVSLTSITLCDTIFTILGNAFENCTSLNNVVIPDSVTAIEDSAFAGCTSLSDITLPKTLVTIGRYAFKNCTSLKEIELPSALGEISLGCFEGSALTHVELPENVKTISAYAFANCVSLENISFPATLENVYDSAFEGCSSIKEVEFYEGFKNLYSAAFKNCTSLKTVSFETLFSIGNNAFYGCSLLEEVLIQDTSSAIPLADSSFEGCSSLKTLEFSVASLGNKTFKDCSSLPSVSLAESVTEIKDSTFFGCSSLSSITLPKQLDSIGKNAFKNCSSLTTITIPSLVTSISEATFFGCEALTSITLPESTTLIESYAFAGCTSIKKITIPESVKHIGAYAFENCALLESVILSSNMTEISEGLFKGCSSLLSVSYTNTITSKLGLVKLHNNITSIGSYAFENCEKITTVNIPEGVSAISKATFAGCTALKDISITKEITKIGDYAFSGCKNLTPIELHEGITNIGSYAFENCRNFTNVYLPDSLVKIGEGVFSGCGEIESISLPFVGNNAYSNTATAATLFGYIFGIKQYGKGVEALQTYESDKTIAYWIPENLTTVEVRGGTINYGSFSDCKTITNLIITDGVKSVKNSALTGCSNLACLTISASNIDSFFGRLFGSLPYSGSAEVTQYLSGGNSETSFISHIPESLATVVVTDVAIKPGTFSGCYMIKNIIITEALDTIPAYAFYGCTGLTNVSILLSNECSDIGAYAFAECESLVSIEGLETLVDAGNKKLSSKIKNINNSAFAGCEKITFELTDDIATIGNNAFNGCLSIKKLILGKSLKYVGNNAFSNTAFVETIELHSNQLTTGVEYTVFKDSGINTNGITLNLDSEVYNIPEYLFYNANALKVINFSKNIQTIGAYAFYGNVMLENIILPQTITAIGSSAFANCNSLCEILYNVPSISNCGAIFARTNYSDTSEILLIIGSSVESIPDSLFKNANIYSVEFEDTKVLKSIESYAFANNSALKSITVPSSVNRTGYAAFSGCSNLEEIILAHVGYSKIETNVGKNTLFGYIFGETYYENAIKAEQLYTNSQIATYYLPASLTNITVNGGNILSGAFYGCSNIKTITVNAEIESIGSYSFAECDTLKEVTLPEGLITIDSHAFFNSASIKNIALPETLENILQAAFKNSGIETITLPDSLKVIGTDAFKSSQNLTSVVFGKNTLSVGTSAFERCENLVSVHINGRDTVIGSKVFNECSALTYVTIDDESCIKNIGSYAFASCSNIRDVVIASGVLNIGEYAFYNCENLVKITLPSTVSEIASYAFKNCKNLEEIILPSSLLNLKRNIFDGCYSISVITMSTDNAKYHTDGNCIIETASKKLVYGCNGSIIPSDGSVEIIDSYAFSNAAMLKEITIPSSVLTINKSAFMGCGALEHITLPFTGLSATAKDAESLLGYIFGIDAYEGSYSVTQSYAPDKSVIYQIPASLKKVTVNSAYINYGALSGCNKITDLYIGDNTLSVSSYAFMNCTELKNVYFGSSFETLAPHAFSGCYKLDTLTVSDSNNTYFARGNCLVEKETKTLVLGTKSSKIPAGEVLVIDSYAFDGVNELLRIAIPDGVLTIREYAFRDCINLRHVEYIGKDVKEISVFAFANCVQIKSFTVSPDNAVYYSEGNAIIEKETKTLVLGCYETTIPEGVKAIGDYAFAGCTMLATITLPSSLESIGNYAFEKCVALENIKIPASVSKIGINAFKSCSELATVEFESCTGWYCLDSASTTFSEKQLSDSSTAAKLLTKSYYAFAWCKK